MKWILILILILLAICANGSQSLPSEFYHAINMVETRGRTGAIHGERGELGPMQIRRQYWQDAGVPGYFTNCVDYGYSCRVMDAYFRRFANEFVMRRDYQSLARVHNGGPQGYTNPATKKYWQKVRKYLTN